MAGENEFETSIIELTPTEELNEQLDSITMKLIKLDEEKAALEEKKASIEAKLGMNSTKIAA